MKRRIANQLRVTRLLFALPLIAIATIAVVPGSGALSRSLSSLSPIQAGDIIAALANGQVNEYTPAGVLVQTLLTAELPTGMAFDNHGNLFVTDFGANDILELNATTMTVSTFSDDSTLGDGSVYNSPESVAFGPGFTSMYITDANRYGQGGGMHVVDSTTGAATGFYSLPSSQGSEGAGESDWDAFDQSGTLYMTNENPTQGVMQVDQTTGDIVSPSFIPNLPNYGYAISFDKNNNLWVGDTNSILEYSTAGTLLNTITNASFSTIFAATFNPTGDTFYAGDLGSGNIFTYDLSGNLLGTFNTGSGIDGLVVAGSTVAPKTPEGTPSPTAVPFGSSPVGTPTASQTVTLDSTGTAALVISGVPTISGTNPGDFHITSNTCTPGLSIAPGGSCTTDVDFDPTATGARSATLEFTDNATDSPQSVSLSGTGGTSCDSGPWPSQVTGVPTVTSNEDRGFYLGVKAHTGKWTFDVTHHEQPRLVLDFSGSVTTDGTFTDVSPIMLEQGDHFSVSTDGHTLTYAFRNLGHVDGVTFKPTCGSTVTFQGSINGTPSLPIKIYLGVPATHPSTNPVTFTRTS